MREHPEAAATDPPVPGRPAAWSPRSSEMLLRHRLLDRLTAGVAGPLTVVHGPAGAGKTVLVSSWVATGLAPGPVAWVSCDQDVNASGPFWTHAREALARCGVPVDVAVGPPASAGEVDRHFLAALAVQISEHPQPVVMVLDQFEAITTPAIHHDLETLLTLAGPQLRLVVLSRRPPPLRLARHRAAGELTEIGAQDLACTVEEARALLALHGATLSTHETAELVKRVAGWVTGMRLSALALHSGSTAAEVQQRLETAHQGMQAFLVEEVLDLQPEKIRDLLLRTCLLERVCGELADALTGRHDGHAILQSLAESGTFVRAVPGSAWFVLHEIFATALQRQLVLTDGDLVPVLRRRASTWLADRELLVEAVAQAAAVQDWELACGHLVDHLAIGHLLVGVHTQRLAQLLADLPADHPSPQVALVRAGLAMARFDVVGCTHAIDQAVAASSTTATRRLPALRLAIATIRVIASRIAGDLAGGEAAAAQGRAQWAEVDPARLERHPELVALLLSSLGTLRLWAGAVSAAEDALHAGLQVPELPLTEQPRSNCLGQLAFSHYVRGRLREASRCAMDALELVERSGLSPTERVPVAHLAAAAVAWEWSDATAVRAHLDHAASSVAVRHDPSLSGLLALLESRHHRSAGDLAGARQVLEGVRDVVARLPAAWLVRVLVVREEAQVLLASGDADAATAVVSQLAEDDAGRRLVAARAALMAGRPQVASDLARRLSTDPAVDLPLTLRGLLLDARSLAVSGDQVAAARRLEKTLRLARDEGFREVFVEEGAFVRQVLAVAPTLAAQHGWLGRRLGVAPTTAADREVPSLVVEPLTTRERDVLVAVAHPMSVREAAAALHLSENTIKTHLRSVYRKLAAPNRNAAIRRARVLGLL